MIDICRADPLLLAKNEHDIFRLCHNPIQFRMNAIIAKNFLINIDNLFAERAGYANFEKMRFINQGNVEIIITIAKLYW